MHTSAAHHICQAKHPGSHSHRCSGVLCGTQTIPGRMCLRLGSFRLRLLCRFGRHSLVCGGFRLSGSGGGHRCWGSLSWAHHWRSRFGSSRRGPRGRGRRLFCSGGWRIGCVSNARRADWRGCGWGARLRSWWRRSLGLHVLLANAIHCQSTPAHLPGYSSTRAQNCNIPSALGCVSGIVMLQHCQTACKSHLDARDVLQSLRGRGIACVQAVCGQGGLARCFRQQPQHGHLPMNVKKILDL